MFAGVLIHLGCLRLGNIPRENAANALALRMHGEHNMSRLFAVHAEENFKHLDYKFHRRVIIVDQHDFEKRGLLELWFDLKQLLTP